MKVIWQCPYCEFKTEKVYDLDVAVQHAWEEHGNYCRFQLNGEDIRPKLNPVSDFIMRVLS